VKIYDFPFAPNPRKLRTYLAEKGIEIPFEVVNIVAGEQNEPAHLARNPMGNVPALELDDGTWLTESLAIIEYFADLHPEQSPVPWCCDPAWTRLLLAHGADPSRPNGFTLPLYQALRPLGYLRDPVQVEAARANLGLLLSRGVDLDARTGDGRSALHIAAIQRDLESVRWLLDRGANPTLRSDRGQTPGDLLRESLSRSGRALKAEERRAAAALLVRLEAVRRLRRPRG